jgi:ribosomal protein S18 acetylase RimI-like enzyme
MDNNEFHIDFLSKKEQHSDFDWANINVGKNRVGKARCQIEKDRLIIYSINVFPEFEGNGYGKRFVEEGKKHFNIIIADRVRYSAIGFWEKVGFIKSEDGNWVYRKQ